MPPKKLIEVALPLEEINSARRPSNLFPHMRRNECLTMPRRTEVHG